jgi:hypothetical protein
MSAPRLRPLSAGRAPAAGEGAHPGPLVLRTLAPRARQDQGGVLPQDGRDDPFGTTSFTFLGYTIYGATPE